MINLFAEVLHKIFKFPSIRDLKSQLQAQKIYIANTEARLKEQETYITEIENRQKALYRVISKIRGSLDLDMIFKATSRETCRLLHAERVAVYRFFDNWDGEFVGDFEFAESGWENLESFGKNTVWNDSYLQENHGGRYQNNEILAVADVYNANLSRCHIDILEQFHIRAYATAPIFSGQKLWGILAIYQHTSARQWQDSELQFLSQVATQLGIAIQQAQLLSETRHDLLEVNHQQKVLFDLITKIRESLDLSVLFQTTTREVRKALHADRVSILKFYENSGDRFGKFITENVLADYDPAIPLEVPFSCFQDQYYLDLQIGKIQVFLDIDRAGFQECYRHLLSRLQVKSQIITPLMEDGELWGLLYIHQCSFYRNWKASEIQFIQQLSMHFSVALDHAKLLTQSQIQAQNLAKTVTALELTNQQLENLTKIDALTQVANRRLFDDVLQKEWQRLTRSERYLSLILLDIDHFKAYNDCYGHPAGDRCLFAIAQAVKSILNRPIDLLARYGGEEFAVILPETDPAGAVRVAQNIQAVIAQLKIETPHPSFDLDGDANHERVFVTVSQGIAVQIPMMHQSLDGLIIAADQALYQAKHRGRNTWVLADHPDHSPEIKDFLATTRFD